MIENPEFGYTPNNLRALREKHGLTQKQVAEICQVSNYQQVLRWEQSAEKSTHANMPYTKWLMLVDFISV